MAHLLNMVILHSYVKQPEGTHNLPYHIPEIYQILGYLWDIYLQDGAPKL